MKGPFREKYRWDAVYGSLVALYIQNHTREKGRLPNDQELQIIVRMASGGADEVDDAWQKVFDEEGRPR